MGLSDQCKRHCQILLFHLCDGWDFPHFPIEMDRKVRDGEGIN